VWTLPTSSSTVRFQHWAKVCSGANCGDGGGGDDHRIEVDVGLDVMAFSAHGVAVYEDSLTIVFLDAVLAQGQSQRARPIRGNPSGVFEQRVVGHCRGAFDAERVGFGP
jgi:hypothetical protein